MVEGGIRMDFELLPPDICMEAAHDYYCVYRYIHMMIEMRGSHECNNFMIYFFVICWTLTTHFIDLMHTCGKAASDLSCWDFESPLKH